MRFAGLLSVAIIAAALAAPASAAEVSVSDGWFRALPAGLPAGGYFKLHNDGNAPVTLVGASSSACGMVMLHESMSMGGTEQMMMVDKVPVPAHGVLEFKPGAYHLMCMKPTAAMKPGAKVPVVLEFADGDKLGVNFAVKNAKGQ
ncbi:MAG: copper chaperone PCu(A)C [Alphaproteobacteria bacterium]|nr:copper chaperone PCu(A)C [Alphaproteobacteria bacterium]MBU6473037.1 copper chaperone PCu(A)C [Alphaproteobacteria bacterium]MDE2072820.1 copper chaperone PCu(A)C [Alphaproteobacteria bacterium]